MTIIGIDLGTTNSAVAYWDGNQTRLIPNKLGKLITPSVVGLDQEGDITVGAIALDRLITHPDKSVSQFKRWMGTSREVQLGTNCMRAEDLSSFVLKSLLEDVKTALEAPVEHLVISVPAYFSDHQRKSTIAAAKLAGVSVTRLVNEPTAAALSYGLNEKGDGKYVVLDLGGGTFDVSILDKYDGIMEIKACAGDNNLGGEDFTDFLVNWLLQKNKIELNKLDVRQCAILRRFAESLKCDLSTYQEKEYELTIGEYKLKGEITRERFEKDAFHLVSRIRAPVERALRDSRVAPSEISQVILVGGATRMPLMRKLASRLFSLIPLTLLDPDHIVAHGAAVQAALIAEAKGIEDIIMTDVCPYTLGTAVVDETSRLKEIVISPIIERNAAIPISRVERYVTANNNQTRIIIDVYQGEQLKPQDNVKIGEVEIQVPPAEKGREAVDVRFTYDINGNLEVEVTVLSTSEKTVQYFQGGSGQLSDEEIAGRFASLNAIKKTPRDQMENRALIAYAERLYAESTGELREVLRTARSNFILKVEDQQNRNAALDRKEFSEFLQSIEQSMFGYLRSDDGHEDND